MSASDRSNSIKTQDIESSKDSQWREMYKNFYGDESQYQAIAELNGFHGSRLSPTKYEKVKIDEEFLNEIKEEASKRPNQSFMMTAPEGKLVIYVPENKLSHQKEKIFVCDKVIGKGIEGQVWRAQVINSKDSEDWYAVKIPSGFESRVRFNKRNQIDQDFFRQQTFLREMEILGETESFIYIEDQESKEPEPGNRVKTIVPMKLAPGITLEKYILEKLFYKKTLTLADLYEQTCIFINILNQLEKLHSKNHIHNDLKPANIQINPYTGDIRLIDINDAPEMRTLERYGTPVFSYPFYFDEKFTLVNSPYYQTLPEVDLFSFGVFAASMLKLFDFRLDLGDKKAIFAKFNSINYSSDCVDEAKELIEFLQTKLLVKNLLPLLPAPNTKKEAADFLNTEREPTITLDEIRNKFKKIAEECYEKLLRDRTQLHKIGIIHFDELVTVKTDPLTKEIKYILRPEMFSALRSLEGFYILMPSQNLDDDTKAVDVNAVINSILEQCKDKQLSVRGIIRCPTIFEENQASHSDSNEVNPGAILKLADEETDDNSEEEVEGIEGEAPPNKEKEEERYPLPSHMFLIPDVVRDQIDRIENCPLVVGGKDTRPIPPNVNAYCLVTEFDDYEERALHAHGLVKLKVKSGKKTPYYEKSARQQLKSILVIPEDMRLTEANLATRQSHFKKRIAELESELTFEPDDKDLQYKLRIYKYELNLTNSLIDKISVQYKGGQLTYQALIESLKGYRSEFSHSNSVQRFFASFCGFKHNTKSAIEIKELESILKKHERKIK